MTHNEAKIKAITLLSALNSIFKVDEYDTEHFVINEIIDIFKSELDDEFISKKAVTDKINSFIVDCEASADYYRFILDEVERM